VEPTKEEQSLPSNIMRRLTAVLVVSLAASTPAVGQWIGKQTGCYADSMAANPNRPTVANPADITQYGVLEIEYSWDRVWPQPSLHQTSFGGLLKFAVLCDVELRWNTTSFLWQTGTTGTSRGFGDNWLGAQVRVYKQTKRVPTLAFAYAGKIPSASAEKGLGTGLVDHSFTFLASKDIAGVHFDFNVTHFLIGRQNVAGFDQGFDRNEQFNLALSRTIHGNLQFTGEFYGDTSLNQGTPGFASSLWALTYTITPRLVIDSGYEAGFTAGGPRRHVFVGFTYSISNLYRDGPR